MFVLQSSKRGPGWSATSHSGDEHPMFARACSSGRDGAAAGRGSPAGAPSDLARRGRPTAGDRVPSGMAAVAGAGYRRVAASTIAEAMVRMSDSVDTNGGIV